MEPNTEIGESFDEYFRELSGLDTSPANSSYNSPAEFAIGFFSQNDT